ncbi:hypothetical protein L615_003300000110 [Nocardioides sp. J9]|uniref:hypothetical protein n=1 Tax=Nocardioides sp. J9 TaxID=935844 RepID=UPI00119EB37A|nr:hypothetical protein [Nocardioides sp. J9]TWG97818.1 hypothetical protein L615_003300000110 [Nocardioides sp. J9]
MEDHLDPAPPRPGPATRLWRLFVGERVTPPEATRTVHLRPERRKYGVGVVLTLLVAALLALNEVNGLSRGFVAGTEAAIDFRRLSGLPTDVVRQSWGLPMATDDLVAWNRLLRCFLVVDVVFIAVYARLLVLVVRSAFVPRTWCPVLRNVVWGLCVADVVENVLMWVSGNGRVGAGPFGGYDPNPALWVATGVKWAAVAVVVALLALSVVVRDRGEVVAPWRRALWIQRYSLLAFLPVAALACLPVPKVGDQVPDIERRWLEHGAEAGHMAFAAVAALVVVAAIFFLGRLRADCAFRRSHDARTDGHAWPWYHPEGQPRHAPLWHWLLAPALAVLLLVLALANDWPVDGRRFAIFCLITVAVPVLSCLARWRFQVAGKDGGGQSPAARPGPPVDPAKVMAVGDVLAIAAVAAMGLGMMRAWTGVLAVGVTKDDVDVPWGWWVALMAAVGAAVAPWWAANRLLSRLDAAVHPDRTTGLAAWATPTAPLCEVDGTTCVTGRTSHGLRVLLLVASGAVLGWMAFDPIGWATTVGVVAAVTLALGALMVLLGVVVAYSQETRPPEALLVVPRPWLTATPIVPFVVVGLFLNAQLGSSTFVHGIGQDGLPHQVVPARPTLAEAFRTWVDGTTGCVVPDAVGVVVDGKEQSSDVRPMLMLAAEGGGIRATYWTALGLEEVADAGGSCGQDLTLFSTGASGGSLGLTIGRYDDEAVRGPDSLGAGAVTLVTGDLVATATGLRLGTPPADTHPDGSDRAAVMQEVWRRAWEDAGIDDGAAAHRFVEEADTAPASVTGHLVLTSTDSYDGCRALWSQVDLSPAELSAAPEMTERSNAPGCGAGGPGPNSYDVLGAFGSPEESTGSDGSGGTDGTDDDQRCLGNVSALTAALVSGRFPYVTPSAVVGPCRGFTQTPLVDGGIADNTGLGTINDLAPQWGALVRAHNDQVLADGTGALVVPMVVYLDNGPATSFGIRQRGRTVSESLVPLWAIGAATTRRSSTQALLQQAADAAEGFLCSAPSVPGTDPTPCEQLLSAQAPQPQVFVVHQATQPTLSAPLGWVLSDASVSDLVSDVAEARATGCGSSTQADPVCVDGHGTLGDLRDRLAPLRKGS